MTTEQSGPVFVSYRQEDGTANGAELAWLLRAAGLPVWRDSDDLPPGDTKSRLGHRSKKSVPASGPAWVQRAPCARSTSPLSNDAGATLHLRQGLETCDLPDYRRWPLAAAT